MIEGKKPKVSLGGDFDPLPSDRYTVQVADVNLVTQFNKFKGEEQEMLNYQFVVLTDKAMPVEEGQDAQSTRGRFLWHRVSLSMGGRSWLNKLVTAVYGRELTREEKEEFDVESIIGKQVDVLTSQNTSKTTEIVYSNIISYEKTAKELETVSDTPGNPEVKNEVSEGIPFDDKLSEVEKLQKEMAAAKAKIEKAE